MQRVSLSKSSYGMGKNRWLLPYNIRNMKRLLPLFTCCTFVLLSRGQVVFHSSDTALENAFAWAKAMALHYRAGPGDPVGPWYESALPPRDAFCIRDVSHQCIGA